MSKKLLLLALTAASVAAFVLPTTAMAEDVPLHAVGVELNKAQTVDGEGSAVLTSSFGNVTCKRSDWTATFTSSTTGTLGQTFHECTDPFGGPCTSEGQPSGTITTTTLEFHLLTVEDSNTHATGPGVLVTPNAGHFATFTCTFIGKVVVGGSGTGGLVGTITKPACGGTSAEPTISFSSSSQATQTHKTVVGTTTEYALTANGAAASVNASGIITLGTAAKLECT